MDEQHAWMRAPIPSPLLSHLFSARQHLRQRCRAFAGQCWRWFTGKCRPPMLRVSDLGSDYPDAACHGDDVRDMRDTRAVTQQTQCTRQRGTFFRSTFSSGHLRFVAPVAPRILMVLHRKPAWNKAVARVARVTPQNGMNPGKKCKLPAPAGTPKVQNYVPLDAWGMHELKKKKARYLLNSRLSFIYLVPET